MYICIYIDLYIHMHCMKLPLGTAHSLGRPLVAAGARRRKLKERHSAVEDPQKPFCTVVTVPVIPNMVVPYL